MKFPEGVLRFSGTSSSPFLARFLGGRARAVLRNSRKDVFPELRVPMMRMLKAQVSLHENKDQDATRRSSTPREYRCKRALGTHFNGVGSFLLRTRRGLLTVLIALLA